MGRGCVKQGRGESARRQGEPRALHRRHGLHLVRRRFRLMMFTKNCPLRAHSAPFLMMKHSTQCLPVYSACSRCTSPVAGSPSLVLASMKSRPRRQSRSRACAPVFTACQRTSKGCGTLVDASNRNRAPSVTGKPLLSRALWPRVASNTYTGLRLGDGRGGWATRARARVKHRPARGEHAPTQRRGWREPTLCPAHRTARPSRPPRRGRGRLSLRTTRPHVGHLRTPRKDRSPWGLPGPR